jgi:alanyl-tRNA synthetase
MLPSPFDPSCDRMLSSDAIRQTFIEFFIRREHTEMPPSSLIPEDSSVLFTSAGMQPLIPYFSGAPHPGGRRLAGWQPCVRTSDIDQVGDSSHLTLFEMLGNWSLGDYFATESLAWSLELLTGAFGLDQSRLAVTVFAGDDDTAFDQVAYDRWRELGISPERIFRYGREHNWWGPAGAHGPCGPDSEIFYWTSETAPTSEPAVDDRWLEVWNNVFITYELTPDGGYRRLAQHNVDTGMGFERIVSLLQDKRSVYETDLFTPIMDVVADLTDGGSERGRRIVCDHLRAATFLIGDGVTPSNVDRGYVLRRLIRRAVRQGRLAGATGDLTTQVAEAVIDRFADAYPQLGEHRHRILDVLDAEEQKFARTLNRGLREIRKLVDDRIPIDGQTLFWLFETHGLPPEVSVEELSRHGIAVSRWQQEFSDAHAAHQQISRHGAERRFAGGLADRTDRTVRLHTATHLLGGALRQVLGDHVHQRGSNITDERLRFDFSHAERLSDQQLTDVETLVNQTIADDIEVARIELPREEAEALGAEREFGQRYPETVTVYVIGDISKEFCGGPHVSRTSQIGRFHLLKQESSGAGVRRIRATIDD